MATSAARGNVRFPSSAAFFFSHLFTPQDFFASPPAAGSEALLEEGGPGLPRVYSTGQVFPGMHLDPASAAVGSHLFSAGSSLVNERLGRGWASLDALRYYFSVNNSYVKNKLRLLLFPFRHKNWTRLMVSQGDTDAYRAPRDDINAPDLYIPVMAFLTWILLSAILLGQLLQFTPEAFGSSTSKGIAVVLLEVLILKAGYYLLSDGPSPPTLVLAAWSGYKFPGICLNLIAFLLLGTKGYYVSLIYNAACMAFFLRGVMQVSWLSTSSVIAGKYFRLCVMLLQLVFPLMLG